MLWACFVALAAAAVYGPILGSDYLVIDDPQYVTSNPYVLYPSWSKLGAVFSETLRPTTVEGYYQPLTLASLMLDRIIEASLRGGLAPRPDPFVFRLTNLLLHGANAALVYLLVGGITRRHSLGMSAGLLFGVHPLHVEVVAWIAQRKALLSTFFVLIGLIAYGRYAAGRRSVWLLVVCAAHLLSVLAKPTSLLLPIVLLLADVWPLRRWSRRCLWEKTPLLAISAVVGWIAYVSQTATVDLTQAGQHRGLYPTLLIAAHNLVFYLAKMIVPVRLCPQYIMPDEWTVGLAEPRFLAGAVGTLALVAWCIAACRRGRHEVWTCLSAYAVLLAPTLTPVRFSAIIAADRFAYLPMIPVLILLAALVARRFQATTAPAQARPAPSVDGPHADSPPSPTMGMGAADRAAERGTVPLFVVGAAVAAVFAVGARRYLPVFADSYAYYDRIISRFPNVPRGYFGRANAYLVEHMKLTGGASGADPMRAAECLDRAAESYQKALDIDPTYSNAWYRLGHIALERGDTPGGIELIKKGLRQPRADTEGWWFLGLAYTHAGDYEKAVEPYRRALQRRPSFPELRKNLANALLRTGRAAEALEHYRRLYELDPTDLDGRQNWGVALLTVGRTGEALNVLRDVVSIRTSLVETAGDEADDASRNHLADARYTLAATLALTGHDAAAMKQLHRALVVKPGLADAARTNPAFESLRGLAEWQSLIDSVTPTTKPE